MGEFLNHVGGAAMSDAQNTPLQRVLGQLMQGQGVEGLVQRLRGAGLDGEVESWIGTGDNRQVSPERLEAALGPEEAQRLSLGAGIPKAGLMAILAMLLPRLIDGLSPRGQLPRGEEARGGGGMGDVLGGILQGGLGGLLGSILGGAMGRGMGGAPQADESRGSAAPPGGYGNHTADEIGGYWRDLTSGRGGG